MAKWEIMVADVDDYEYGELRFFPLVEWESDEAPALGGLRVHDEYWGVELLEDGVFKCGWYSDTGGPVDVEELWDALTDVAVDDDGFLLEPFARWRDGVNREEIWKWFDRMVPVHELMFPGEKRFQPEPPCDHRIKNDER